jgi:hypothetical protein
MVLPPDHRIPPPDDPANTEVRAFLDELGELSDRSHLHLEVMDDRLVAVDDRPGSDIVPVVWDEAENGYRVAIPA